MVVWNEKIVVEKIRLPCFPGRALIMSSGHNIFDFSFYDLTFRSLLMKLLLN